MRICGIIQARLDSTRLPGKALIKVNGIPIIGYVFLRAKQIQGLSELILATTTRSIDDPLVNYAREMGISTYRGDLENVADRFLKCAQNNGADYFLRINGDSPFIDKKLIEQSLVFCKGNFDLISNIVQRNFPYGISVEIIRTRTFVNIYPNLHQPDEKEHITKFFYDHIDQFNVKSILPNVRGPRTIRMVVDNENDLNNFVTVIEKIKGKAITADYQEIACIYRSLIG